MRVGIIRGASLEIAGGLVLLLLAFGCPRPVEQSEAPVRLGVEGPVVVERLASDLKECEPQACGPAMAAPNYPCADGQVGGPGPCQRRPDGTCRWLFVDCAPRRADPPPTADTPDPEVAPEAEPEAVEARVTPPKRRPPVTREGAKRCGRLPSVKKLKTWRVHGFCGAGSSFAGPPPPGGHRSSSPRPIKKLNDGTFIAQDASRGCFRARVRRCLNKCLAPDTLIDTPEGEVPLDTLSSGHPVWTRDAAGRRVATTVLRVQRVPAGPEHRMLRLRLADGRSLTVSPGHPVVGGSGVETLRLGGPYDGAVVSEAALVPYEHDATHDLLPAGETGIYWANGVPLESTMSRFR